MKFVISFTPVFGASAADNVASLESSQKLLANWTPNPSGTIHEWVERCDGQGGFCVLESNSAADLFRDLATWSPWLTFQVFPVVDIVDAASLTQEALALAQSVV